MNNPTIDIESLIYNTMLETLIATQEAHRDGLRVQAYKSMDRGLCNSGITVFCGKMALASVRTPSAIASAVATAKAMRRIAKIEAVANGNTLVKSALEQIPPAWNVDAIIDCCQQNGIDIASHIGDGMSFHNWISDTFKFGDFDATSILKKPL